MGDFRFHSIEDLVFNKSFREWVLTPASADAAFWEEWIKENPGKTETVNQSKAVIYALQFNLKGLSDEAVKKEIGKILQKLHADEAPAAWPEAAENSPSARSNKAFAWVGATVLLILAAIPVFIFRGSFSKENAAGYDAFISERNTAAVRQVNNADTTLVITLPDKSAVYLEKGSQLSYEQRFSGARREVFLTGAAFFKVQKNASQPFLVYTSSIVAKVLGTSFRVRAYPSDKKAVITVKTGRVSVFKTQNFDQAIAKGTAPGGVVLTPNQEVVYTRESNELNKKLTELPQVVAVPSKKAFVFDATPVRQVFKVMQDTYGIPIVYDEDVMAGCSLSASMGEESFYDKLNLICKALNASYEVIDGQIVVMSKGCTGN